MMRRLSPRTSFSGPLAVAAIVLATAFASSGPLRAAESYDGCAGFIDSLPAVLGTQGVWCFDRDLTTAMASGAAITIDANNVTVDCNGFRLGGLAAGAGTAATGITNTDRLNSVVRNCSIRGFAVGIGLKDNAAGDGGHVVEDNRLDGNTAVGVAVSGHGSVVRRNLVRETGGSTESSTGFGVVTTGTAFVDDNIVIGVSPGDGGMSAWGLYLVDNVGGAVRRNIVTDVFATSGNAAVTVLAGTRMWFDGNRVSGDNILGSVGVACSTSSTRLTNNSITGFGNNEDGCSRPAVDNNDIP